MTGAGTETPPILPPAFNPVFFDKVDSTNEVAKGLAEKGAADGTLVWAREQTKGRGRRGKDWASPPGNLYLSLVLRPDCPLTAAPQLGFATALAIGHAIGSVCPPLIAVTYKWPNDVLVNDRKAAGILLESKADASGALEWLVIGVGANVASHPEGTVFPATDLHFEGSLESEVTVEALLGAFCRQLLTWVNSWLDDGFAPLKRAWLGHAHRLGERVTLRLADREMSGIFRDLDENGALLLELDDGSVTTVTAAEVSYGA